MFVVLAILGGMVFASAARAQLQQPFVYMTGGAVATRNDASGALTLTSGSPLPTAGFPAVIDAKGRFLFAGGNNSIRMYRVATTGLYTEVTGSPFASANTNGPILLATEPTGTYLGVLNSTGSNPGESSVESFQIDATGEALVPVQGSFVELVSSPIGAAANPAAGRFFVYLGPNAASPNAGYQEDGDLLTYTIDSNTGLLGGENGANTAAANHGRSFGTDPLGRFVVNGQGQRDGLLEVTSAAGIQAGLVVGSGIYPQEIFVGPGQRFVYATLLAGPSGAVHIYIVDTVNWTLTEAPSSPLPGFTSVAGLVADPTGDFVYESTANNQVRVFAVDLSTGYLSEVVDSPFTGAGLGLPIAFSVVPGTNTQNEVGAVATLIPANLALGTSAVGAPAGAQTIALSSTGNQGLTVNGIGVTGINASDFSETDNCGAPTVLAPGNSCFMSIVFTPAAAGARQAQIAIIDNSPGSPQTVMLTGIGAGSPPPAPAITLVPGTINFPSTAQNSSSSPQSVTVTNSGNAALNISAVLLGGANAGDFSAPSSNCVGAPIAAGGNCTVTETFRPTSAGARQATVSLTDNSPGSPHSIALMGTGAAPVANGLVGFLPNPVNFPVITQGLTSTPLVVTITNSSKAPLHISNIAAGGSSPAEFSNSMGACGAATVAPGANCAMNVTFSPTFSGQRGETLTVTDDGANSPQVLNVMASAAPAFTVTSAASTLLATVRAGQTASYSLQLTPGLDYNGVIGFTCTGAPTGAACSVPPLVTLNVDTPAPMVVTVSTSGKSTGFVSFFRMGVQRTILAATAISLAVSILAFCLVLGVGRRNVRCSAPRQAIVFAIIAWVLFLPLIMGLEGCGGGAASTPTPQGSSLTTPSGTFMIVLTPTATGPSGKVLMLTPIPLTLVVQ